MSEYMASTVGVIHCDTFYHTRVVWLLKKNWNNDDGVNSGEDWGPRIHNYKCSKTPILCFHGDHLKSCKICDFFLWAFGQDRTKVHKFAENAKFRNVKSRFYCIYKNLQFIGWIWRNISINIHFPSVETVLGMASCLDYAFPIRKYTANAWEYFWSW